MNKIINIFIPKSKRIEFAIKELLYYHKAYDRIPKANIKEIDEIQSKLTGFNSDLPFVSINKRKLSSDYNIRMPKSCLTDLLDVVRLLYFSHRRRLMYPLFFFFYDNIAFVREMYDGCFSNLYFGVYE
jgi:hypothetical protein